MKTTAELSGLIGRQVLIGFENRSRDKVERFSVPMEIKDAKGAYGQTYIKVKPVGGSGEGWVHENRIVPE